MPEVSAILAFAYGMLSFLSPCILPLIPVYLVNISGTSDNNRTPARWRSLINSLSFVLGFSLVFTLWGAGAGLLGNTIAAHIELIRKIVGWVLIAFGLVMMISLRVPWLNFEARLRVKTSNKSGIARSFIMGAVFPVAWTPCASWVLGSILLLAGTSESAARGALLLALYSLGLGIPFLIIGLGLDYLTPVLNRIKKLSTVFYLVSALLLIGVGLLLVTDRLTWFIGKL